eukprot:scaffold106802_cov45-Phaeocystis_antarctica.AAC.2
MPGRANTLMPRPRGGKQPTFTPGSKQHKNMDTQKTELNSRTPKLLGEPAAFRAALKGPRHAAYGPEGGGPAGWPRAPRRGECGAGPRHPSPGTRGEGGIKGAAEAGRAADRAAGRGGRAAGSTSPARLERKAGMAASAPHMDGGRWLDSSSWWARASWARSFRKAELMAG